MDRISKRALVLSGGGAKGVYEAGVLHACHHTGLTFDVITGSSIGAINAVLWAEYQRRRQLSAQDAARRARTAAQADQIYRASHDVFVIFLGPRPEVGELKPGQAQGMLAYEYGLRAYELMQNAKLTDDTRSAQRITQLMEQAAGWKQGDRPKRILVNVNRIYPQEMLTGTLTFHRRMGFNRARNRQLLAEGCATMLTVLAEPPNFARLGTGVQQKLRDLRKLDAAAPHGWRCTHTACRVRDACTQT